MCHFIARRNAAFPEKSIYSQTLSGELDFRGVDVSVDGALGRFLFASVFGGHTACKQAVARVGSDSRVPCSTLAWACLLSRFARLASMAPRTGLIAAGLCCCGVLNQSRTRGSACLDPPYKHPDSTA